MKKSDKKSFKKLTKKDLKKLMGGASNTAKKTERPPDCGSVPGVAWCTECKDKDAQTKGASKARGAVSK